MPRGMKLSDEFQLKTTEEQKSRFRAFSMYNRLIVEDGVPSPEAKILSMERYNVHSYEHLFPHSFRLLFNVAVHTPDFTNTFMTRLSQELFRYELKLQDDVRVLYEEHGFDPIVKSAVIKAIEDLLIKLKEDAKCQSQIPPETK